MHNKGTRQRPQGSGRGWKHWYLAVLLVVASGLGGKAQTLAPVVHVVLFYSPTCPHCEYTAEAVTCPFCGDGFPVAAFGPVGAPTPRDPETLDVSSYDVR